jgi:hypothetical protein
MIDGVLSTRTVGRPAEGGLYRSVSSGRLKRASSALSRLAG